MSGKMLFEVTPGGAAGAAKWVLDRFKERERARFGPLHGDRRHPSRNPFGSPAALPRLSQLRAGHSAFAELYCAAPDLGLWILVDRDAAGPRIRIGPLVVEPAVDLGAWEIEVS